MTTETKKQPNQNQNGNTTAWGEDEGFTTMDTGEERVYWFVDQGEVISGKLLGETSYDDEDPKTGEVRRVAHFVIETDRPTKVTKAKESEKPFIVPAGSVVFANERHQLAPLRGLLQAPVFAMIRVQAVEKQKINGGRSVWRFRWAVKPTTEARLQTPTLAQGGPLAALPQGDDLRRLAASVG